ncbi:glucosamine-6-phosphate deaminase [Brachybacterium sp. AOP25-B2-12]|uniref:glucosamine-6-phosphate deaminase n=1 Tax=Brachybacterium sp. AOP25-B2-12 TaxID=3457710 RepID=UPI004033BD7B
MEVIVVDTAEDVAQRVADRFDTAVRGAGDAGITLGLATGSSPVRAYRELIRRYREEGLSFARARAFLLDEYVGLPTSAPQSYHRFIRDNFTDHVDIDDALVLSPAGDAADPASAAAAYDRSIVEAGGVDIQILGIGTDGHIGFNEPTSSFASRTRVKTLTRQTVADNARFFDAPEDVPVHVLTQGLGTILEARKIVLAASGESKAEAIAQAVEGPVSALWPATALQLHPAVTVVVDREAGSRLALGDYYQFVQENKARLSR